MQLTFCISKAGEVLNFKVYNPRIQHIHFFPTRNANPEKNKRAVFYQRSNDANNE